MNVQPKPPLATAQNAQVADLARYLEMACNVIDKSKIIWLGEGAARALIAKARGEVA